MSDFLSPQLNPDRVFSDKYWGEIQPPPHLLIQPPSPRRFRQAAKHMLIDVVPLVVSGDISGQVLERGRFNPSDPDLARASAHNMPKTVLIADIEGLRPLDSFSETQRNHPYFAGRGEPLDQASSTRHLLQVAKKTKDDMAEYQKGRVIYSNDEYKYSRTVSINTLVPNRQPTSTPYGLRICTLPIQPDTPGGHLQLTRRADLYEDVQIGESYEHTAVDSRGRATYLGIKRLISLEVCMQGEPAQEPASAFSRGWVLGG